MSRQEYFKRQEKTMDYEYQDQKEVWDCMDKEPKVAKRFNTGKPMLSYFARSFPKTLEGIARVMELGACKYGDNNWRLGGKPDSEYLDSMTRHLDAFLKGETYDQDSGCHHLAHFCWNACALYELNYQDVPVIDESLFDERMKYWAKEENK